jgi:hypothetical protein
MFSRRLDTLNRSYGRLDVFDRKSIELQEEHQGERQLRICPRSRIASPHVFNAVDNLFSNDIMNSANFYRNFERR